MKTFEQKTCGHKVRYSTFKEAQAQCKWMRENKATLMHAYECPVCGFFHVGHNSTDKLQEVTNKLKSNLNKTVMVRKVNGEKKVISK